jgi:hypothetical protein
VGAVEAGDYYRIATGSRARLSRVRRAVDGTARYIHHDTIVVQGGWNALLEL